MDSSTSSYEQLTDLFEKEEWTEEERQWVLLYLNQNDGKHHVASELYLLMLERFSNNSTAGEAEVPDWNNKKSHILAAIHQRIKTEKPLYARLAYVRSRKFWAAAASFLLIFSSLLGYLLLNNQHVATLKNSAAKSVPVKSLQPGINNAKLILSDGTIILLDSAANGMLSREGDIAILKQNGQLTYTGSSGDINNSYNTLSTAKGQQYQLTLADGSKVWLNATSSIRFPAAFAGKQRRVEVTGEAYFEVAHNDAQPFIVQINSASGKDGGEVQVLGTHFNINAYEDEEDIKTTLIEGAVRFAKNNKQQLLRPGQQVSSDYHSENLKVSNADIENAIAWKNGLFQFEEERIENVMRQIARWYDAEVIYEGAISKETFSGIVSRGSSINQVLNILEAGGVRFKVNGKKIIVTK